MRTLLLMIALACPAGADTRTNELCRLFSQVTGPAFDFQTDLLTELGKISKLTTDLVDGDRSDDPKLALLAGDLQRVGKIVQRYYANDAKTKRDLRRIDTLCNGG